MHLFRRYQKTTIALPTALLASFVAIWWNQFPFVAALPLSWNRLTRLVREGTHPVWHRSSPSGRRRDSLFFFPRSSYLSSAEIPLGRPFQEPIAAHRSNQKEESGRRPSRHQGWKDCECLDDVRRLLNNSTNASQTGPDEKTEWHTSRLSPAEACHALKRTSQLLFAEARQRKVMTHITHDKESSAKTDNIISDSLLPIGDMLPSLLKPIVRSLTTDVEQESDSRKLTIYMVADCLISLSNLLSSLKGKEDFFETIAPVQLLLWGRLEDWQSETMVLEPTSASIDGKMGERKGRLLPATLQLSPGKLVGCLRAIHLYSDAIVSALYGSVVDRLCQGDALAQLNARDLITLLHISRMSRAEVIDSITKTKSSCGWSYLPDGMERLTICAARRLRKRSVREKAPAHTLVQAIANAQMLFSKLSPLSSSNSTYLQSLDDDDDLRRELQLLVYTLTKQLVSMSANDSSTVISVSEAVTVCIAIRSVLILDIEDSLVSSVCSSLVEQASKWSTPSISVQDIAYLLASLEIWQRKEAVSSFVFILGKHFHALVVDDRSCLDGRIVNTILRSAVFLLEPNDAAMIPYLKASQVLLTDQKFLGNCASNELSNFCWFLAFKSSIAHQEIEAILPTLGSRLLEKDIVNTCTPKQACRILSAFTALCTRPELLNVGEDLRHSMLISNLFECHGEHLLSTRLSPLDTSSAVYAYAKAQYVADMGIFDHLVNMVASQASHYSNRQISQTLWACGRMISYDSIGVDEDDLGNEFSSVASYRPPYVSSATTLAIYLASSSSALSCKDVVQALWALSHLGLNDARIIEPLVDRVHMVATNLNVQERANLLWALSKLRSHDSKVIFLLTRPFANPSNVNNDGSCHMTFIKPQEASNILYALGRMNIRDESVFRNLTDLILEQIDSVSAQTVANVLWAHRAVHLEPPRLLLDKWAGRRLPGLVFASDPRADYNF